MRHENLKAKMQRTDGATYSKTITNFSDILRVKKNCFPLYPTCGMSDSHPGSIKVMLRIARTHRHAQLGGLLSVDETRKLVTVIDPSCGSGRAAADTAAVAAGLNYNAVASAASPRSRYSGNNSRMFSFDRVFQPSDSIADVCSNSLTDVMETLLSGFDACIFTFGHSKVGKTFTMLGDDQSEHSIGLIPYAIGSLYQLIGEQKSRTGARFSVRISAIEVTGKNETLRDLLAETDNEIISSAAASSETLTASIRDDPVRGPQLENVRELRATSAEYAGHLVDLAIAARTVPDSSDEAKNSHMLFTIHLYQYRVNSESGEKHQEVIGGRSRLHLIDFGSCSKTKSGTTLNLSTLGTVITALLSGQRHVPFRDSKLVLLLRYATGSSTCSTTMLAHVSAHPHLYPDTLHIIQTAARIYRLRVRKKCRGSVRTISTSSGSTHQISSGSSSCTSGSRPLRTRRRPGVRMGTGGGRWQQGSSNSSKRYQSDPECSSGSSANTVVFVGGGSTGWRCYSSASEYTDCDDSSASSCSTVVYRSQDNQMGMAAGYLTNAQFVQSSAYLPPSAHSLSGSCPTRRHRYGRQHTWETPILEYPEEEETSEELRQSGEHTSIERWVDGPPVKGHEKPSPRWPSKVELWVDGPKEFCQNLSVQNVDNKENVKPNISKVTNCKSSQSCENLRCEAGISGSRTLRGSNSAVQIHSKVSQYSKTELEVPALQLTCNPNQSTSVEKVFQYPKNELEVTLVQQTPSSICNSVDSSGVDISADSSFEQQLDDTLERSSSASMQDLVIASDDDDEFGVKNMRFDNCEKICRSISQDEYSNRLSFSAGTCNNSSGFQDVDELNSVLSGFSERNCSQNNGNYRLATNFNGNPDNRCYRKLNVPAYLTNSSSSAPVSPIASRQKFLLPLQAQNFQKLDNNYLETRRICRDTISSLINFDSVASDCSEREYSHCNARKLGRTGRENITYLGQLNAISKLPSQTKHDCCAKKGITKKCGYKTIFFEKENNAKIFKENKTRDKPDNAVSVQPVKTGLGRRITALLSPYHKVTQPRRATPSTGSDVTSSASNPVLTGCKWLSESSSGYESMIRDDSDLESSRESSIGEYSSSAVCRDSRAKRYINRARGSHRREKAGRGSSFSPPITNTDSEHTHLNPTVIPVDQTSFNQSTSPVWISRSTCPTSIGRFYASSSHPTCMRQSIDLYTGVPCLSIGVSISPTGAPSSSTGVPLLMGTPASSTDVLASSTSIPALLDGVPSSTNESASSIGVHVYTSSIGKLASSSGVLLPSDAISTIERSSLPEEMTSSEANITSSCQTLTSCSVGQSSSADVMDYQLTVADLCLTHQRLQEELLTALGRLMLQPSNDAARDRVHKVRDSIQDCSIEELQREISQMKRQLHFYKSRVMLVTSFDTLAV